MCSLACNQTNRHLILHTSQVAVYKAITGMGPVRVACQCAVVHTRLYTPVSRQEQTDEHPEKITLYRYRKLVACYTVTQLERASSLSLPLSLSLSLSLSLFLSLSLSLSLFFSFFLTPQHSAHHKH